MTSYASPQAYRESSVLTASPAQLVVMLYDGAGRFLLQAQAAADEGSWLHCADRIGKAEAIIDELLITLDLEAGQVAERLQAIYVFCKRELIAARLERDSEKILRVRNLLRELRDAWAEIGTGAAA
jgi:flagellar secretion chaperone FliS